MGLFNKLKNIFNNKKEEEKTREVNLWDYLTN